MLSTYWGSLLISTENSEMMDFYDLSTFILQSNGAFPKFVLRSYSGSQLCIYFIICIYFHLASFIQYYVCEIHQHA